MSISPVITLRDQEFAPTVVQRRFGGYTPGSRYTPLKTEKNNPGSDSLPGQDWS